MTRLQRDRAETIEAIVEIKFTSTADAIELIAHEIEHIIEQLDDVDLALRAAYPNSGVKRLDDGTFETLRAKRVGLKVVEEMQ